MTRRRENALNNRISIVDHPMTRVEPKVQVAFRIYKDGALLHEVVLSRTCIKIGTVPSADLQINDATVSKMHAIIEVNGPKDVSIIDLHSTKGTFVNDKKVLKGQLQSGDTILIGQTRLEIAITYSTNG